ncbi:MAG: hypothetical protein ACR2MN_01695, partial [Acidimicrobiales bacterium]
LAVIDEDRRARLARAAGAVGSDVLAGETAWKVMAAAARYEQTGKYPARVIAELGADTTVERTVEALHPGPLTADQILAGSYAAMGGTGQGRPLVAGIVPPVSAYADPAVAVWAADAAGRLEALRGRLADGLATSEPPPWAAALGGRPHDPAQIGPWARAAAQVALYREAAGITEPDDLLGPDLADSNPLATPATSPAEQRAPPDRSPAHNQSEAPAATPAPTPVPRTRRPRPRRHQLRDARDRRIELIRDVTIGGRSAWRTPTGRGPADRGPDLAQRPDTERWRAWLSHTPAVGSMVC